MSSSTGWLQPLSDGGRVIKTECITRLPESVQVALAMAASARRADERRCEHHKFRNHLTTASSAHTADPAYSSPQSSPRKHCPALRTAASTHP